MKTRVVIGFGYFEVHDDRSGTLGSRQVVARERGIEPDLSTAFEAIASPVVIVLAPPAIVARLSPHPEPRQAVKTGGSEYREKPIVAIELVNGGLSYVATCLGPLLGAVLQGSP